LLPFPSSSFALLPTSKRPLLALPVSRPALFSPCFYSYSCRLAPRVLLGECKRRRRKRELRPLKACCCCFCSLSLSLRRKQLPPRVRALGESGASVPSPPFLARDFLARSLFSSPRSLETVRISASSPKKNGMKGTNEQRESSPLFFFQFRRRRETLIHCSLSSHLSTDKKTPNSPAAGRAGRRGQDDRDREGVDKGEEARHFC
jgi:hypothetical protein